jgi:hypothetical protein
MAFPVGSPTSPSRVKDAVLARFVDSAFSKALSAPRQSGKAVSFGGFSLKID